MVVRERWLRLRLYLRVSALAPTLSRHASVWGGRRAGSFWTTVAHAFVCSNWLRHISGLCRDTQQLCCNLVSSAALVRLLSSVAVYPMTVFVVAIPWLILWFTQLTFTEGLNGPVL